MDRKYNTWQEFEGGHFSPAYNFRKELPGGLYRIEYFEMENRYALFPVKFEVPEIIPIPSIEIEELNNEVTQFFESYDKLKEMGLPRSRGILLYGSVGNGKSKSIESLILNFLKTYENGIVFNLFDNDQLGYYLQMFNSQFRILQKDTKVICVCEDIERFSGNDLMMSLLLNLLDGINSAEHLFIATTNYPHKLDARLNRPGRFDRKIKLSLPDDRLREHFFNEIFKKSKYVPENMKELVAKSKGLSYASLREVAVSLIVYKKPIDEITKIIFDLSKITSSDCSNHNAIGFGNNHHQ